MRSIAVLFALALGVGLTGIARAQEPPLRLGIVGLVHDHVLGREGLRSLGRSDVDVVGIYEPNEALAARYADRFGFDSALHYTDLEEMLDATRPEAVMVFTHIRDHRRVVEACARRGIHVMVEKPLAIDVEEARAMARAAEEGGIHVLVNYETSWYPSNVAVFERFRQGTGVGEIRKMVAHDGHEGPKEIGVTTEFLDWLTDPHLNGAGALYDFGCYGGNLMTWLMDGARPTTVTAVTQQLKEDPAYARVDDEATIVLEYPSAQGIIQASWNWPFSRKDLEVYGAAGYAHALDPTTVAVRLEGSASETRQEAPPLAPPFDDALAYLRAVARGQVAPEARSSLENNLVVTEILDAARRSARTGRTVYLPDEEGFVTLFDGRTLDGWQRHEGLPESDIGGKWEVIDGAIVGDQDPPGRGGFLVTTERFDDFVLKLEAKLDYPVDSGLFLRVGDDGKSHQVTLDHRPNGDIGGIYLPWTQGAVLRNPKGIEAFRPDAWNELEVRVEGEPARIRFWVNGTLVTDFQHTEETTKGVPRTGTIGLQVHPGEDWIEGNKVRFRNVRVKEL